MKRLNWEEEGEVEDLLSIFVMLKTIIKPFMFLTRFQ